jgi:hypothetical protein
LVLNLRQSRNLDGARRVALTIMDSYPREQQKSHKWADQPKPKDRPPGMSSAPAVLSPPPEKVT